MPLPRDARFDFRRRAGQEFCCYHDILTLCVIPDRPAEILLACAALIGDRRIKEIYAQFQASFYDFTGLFFIHRPSMLSVLRIAEAHTAHTDTGYLQIGIS